MVIGAIVFAFISFTVGMFLWSKYGIRRKESGENKFNN